SIKKGFDSVAYITKRGGSYLAQVSLYQKGEHKRLTKTFRKKSDAKLWSLEVELAKGNGKELANRLTSFASFFENWIYIVKQRDVKESTFQNYVQVSAIVKELFGDIQLKDLNDIVVQKR